MGPSNTRLRSLEHHKSHNNARQRIAHFATNSPRAFTATTNSAAISNDTTQQFAKSGSAKIPQNDQAGSRAPAKPAETAKLTAPTTTPLPTFDEPISTPAKTNAAAATRRVKDVVVWVVATSPPWTY